jgi:hypothetical protein
MQDLIYDNDRKPRSAAGKLNKKFRRRAGVEEKFRGGLKFLQIVYISPV